MLLVKCSIMDVDVFMLTFFTNSKLFGCFEILFIDDENQVCTIVYYSELGREHTCDIGQE